MDPTVADLFAPQKKQLQQTLTQQQAITESRQPSPMVDPTASITDLFANRPINVLPTFQQSINEQLDTMGWPSILAMGSKARFDQAAYKLKQAAGGILSDKEAERAAIAPEVLRRLPGALGGIALEALGTQKIFGNLGAAGQGLRPPMRLATTTAGSTAAGAGLGALTAPEGKTYEGALMGATFGGLGSLGSQVMAGPFRPQLGSEADQFARSGLALTPGMAAGGITKKLEDANAMINPLITNRKNEVFDQWAAQAMNNTLRRAGEAPVIKLEEGNIAAQGATAFDNAYTKAYSSAGPIKFDPQLSSSLDDIYRTYGPRLNKSDAAKLKEELGRIEGEFHKPKPTFMPVPNTPQAQAALAERAGLIDPKALRRLSSSYDNLASDAYKGNNMAGRVANDALGDAYVAAHDALRDTLKRQAPGASATLDKVDKGYADFLRLQAAAGKVGSEAGTFVPNAAKAAIKDFDRSGQKRAFARGTTSPELRAEVEKAIRVLGGTNVEPAMQSAMGRMLMNAALYGSIGYGTGYVAGSENPLGSALLLGLVGAGGYSKFGNQLMTGKAPSRSVFGRELLRQPQSMPGIVPALGTSIMTPGQPQE